MERAIRARTLPLFLGVQLLPQRTYLPNAGHTNTVQRKLDDLSSISMLYGGAVVSLGYVSAFTPFGAPLQLPAHPAVTASRVLMSASGGTETMDIELGIVVNDRELLDDDLLRQGRRARPGIDWSNLRARLELEFKLSDEQLKNYDEISKDDLLTA